jgi:hypothetical protein
MYLLSYGLTVITTKKLGSAYVWLHIYLLVIFSSIDVGIQADKRLF